ncbi:Alpha/Beta hydrolase protein [Mycena sp. CBHHK59/15]|nr:Alpha/Beta hydrolase protein [Mycena sp. CBHHK59/15]
MSYKPPLSARPSTRPTSSYPPLLPIFPPPVAALPHPLPSAPAPRPFPNPRYIVSTHVVPAAYLRTMPLASTPPPAAPAYTASKTERKSRHAERAAWVVAESQRERGRHERVLWSAVNRYVRADVANGRGGGLTLFLAHANGFPKETWEPTLLHLFDTLGGALVDEIWAWEAPHHGASFLLNADIPFSACDWVDNARDVLTFLLHFLPSSIAGPDEPLPVHLPRVAPEERALRKVRGFKERELLAVGHSFGGCCCSWAALTHPRLFSSLMLVDPVIISSVPLEKDNPGPSLLAGAVARRETWASREEAHASFATNPFFAAWDPRVLTLYVAHGLSPAPGGGVQLAMPGVQEALVWDMLPELEERIELRWVVPGKPGEPELGGPGATQERVWRRPANSSNVRIPQAGHLIAQEAPRELAREIAEMIERKYMNVDVKPRL